MLKCFLTHFVVLGAVLHCNFLSSWGKSFGEQDLLAYRERVVSMFHHAYDGYINHAYPFDELRPLTCDGQDTWGSFSLTLIDALDTLAVMGNYSEFQRVTELLSDEVNFDIDINASVFETNIRVIGGLISAHLFSRRAGVALEPGWPCSGPLLRLAENVARKLLPAFNTTTGMPYGTVNLKYGVPKGETTVTCTAGVGTYIVEFGALSRLTGDPVFEKTAIRALRALWDARSSIGLVGNHVDILTGKWTATEAGIGGGVDSYFEYLVKGAVMLESSELLNMYREYETVLETYLKRDDWYMWANMKKGGITLPVFQSLDAFWPGMQSMVGDIDKAMKTIHNFHQVWRQFGFTPEIYNIPKAEAHQGREGYPLRPELVESAMYLYRATGDPYLLEIGVDVLEAIEHSTKTRCGYATVKDVTSHTLDNRMESFFLAETTKYLYLLFTPDHFIHNTGGHGDVVTTPNGECVLDAGGYIFNTEAHPVDIAALYCCSAQKKEDDKILQDLHDNLDLLTLLDIVDPLTDLFAGGKLEKRRRKIDLKNPKKKMNSSDMTRDVAEEDSDEEDESLTDEKDKDVNTMVDNSSQDLFSQFKSDVSAAQDSSEGQSIKTQKEEVKWDAEKLLTELGSKLNIDMRQFSVGMESPGSRKVSDEGEPDIEENVPENTERSEQTEGQNQDPSVQSLDLGKDKTVSQEGDWVHIKTDSVKNTKTSEKSTMKAEKINTNIHELATMIKNILSSSSKDKFSGNTGFTFGRNIKTTQKQTEDKPLYFGVNKPEQLVCPAQPYHMRISVMGEMFDS